MTLEAVACGIADKLIRRHPHVFGDNETKLDSPDEVLDRWELIKEQEKKNAGLSQETNPVFKDLPPKLPALLYARDVYKRASKHGLVDKGEWSEAEVGKAIERALMKVLLGKLCLNLWLLVERKGLILNPLFDAFASKQVKILK